MADVAIVVLTAALVLVTAYYAWQNRQMVQEMRAARAVSILPKVVVRWTYVGPGVGFPHITNVGVGAALDVNVELSFEPGGGFKRRWRAAVLTPGDGSDFLLRAPGGFASLDDLTTAHETMHLVGTCRDALGAEHTIDESIEIRESWQLTQAASERVKTDYQRKMADQLEAIAKAVKEMSKLG